MLTAERLRSVLSYDPETGGWTWIARTGQGCNIRIGAPAGTRRRGYIRIKIDGKLYAAHRLAFLWMLGRWPRQECDHKDSNGVNNQWSNLREANRHQNNRNKRLGNNAVGLKGVTQLPAGRYRAVIRKHGKNCHIGVFDTPMEAHIAYRGAAAALYGEFARAQ